MPLNVQPNLHLITLHLIPHPDSPSSSSSNVLPSSPGPTHASSSSSNVLASIPCPTHRPNLQLTQSMIASSISLTSHMHQFQDHLQHVQEQALLQSNTRAKLQTPPHDLQSEPLAGREAAAPSFIRKVHKIQGGKEVPPNGCIVLPKNVHV